MDSPAFVDFTGGLEAAYEICVSFISTGGPDGKGTGGSNTMGQGQEDRLQIYKCMSQLSMLLKVICLHA